MIAFKPVLTSVYDKVYRVAAIALSDTTVEERRRQLEELVAEA